MARPPAPVAQPAGGPPQASRGGLLARVGGSRNGAILAAGATVAVVGLLGVLRGKNKASEPPDQTITQAGDGFDSGPYDMWDQWEQQYEGLQGRVSTLENPPTPDPIPKPPPASTIPKPVPLPAPLPKPPVVKPPVHVATPPKAVPKPPTRTVVVKRGDTLSGIAAKYHISMATLKKLNPVYWTNPKYKQGNSIWAGDKVKV
jgi:LysM repeat protein